MKHLKGFRKLNRTASHRKALYSNMAVALFKNERIRTTLEKAKELRRFVAKIITRARVDNLHNIRLVARVIKDKGVLSKIFEEISPRYLERPGGYTRIIKLDRRKGDGAQMAFIELVEEQVVKKKKKSKIRAKVESKKKTQTEQYQTKVQNEEKLTNVNGAKVNLGDKQKTVEGAGIGEDAKIEESSNDGSGTDASIDVNENKKEEKKDTES